MNSKKKDRFIRDEVVFTYLCITTSLKFYLNIAPAIIIRMASDVPS